MNGQALPFDLPPLTPLERLCEDARTAYLLRQWYELNAWSLRATAEIRARAEHHNRSLGQQFRFAEARLRRNFLPPEAALGHPGAVVYYARPLMREYIKNAYVPQQGVSQ